jgi:hypothetical protein
MRTQRVTPQRVERFVLPIRKEETLKQFIHLAFGVTLPDKQVCANHSTPWRAFADAYFARSPVSVWKASRGFGGKSFLLALLGLVEAITLKADVNILGGSGEQSKRILEHETRFWNAPNAPRKLLVSEPSQRIVRFRWGNTIQALMASQASVRGPHPQRLRLDEIDEMDMDILDAAMGQPFSRNGVEAQTVMSSTHQYADGTMTQILQRAIDQGWSVHEWCYRETMQPHGWLPAREVERKRKELTAAMFAVEIELQEPSPESRAILPEAVDAMFRKELGVFEGSVGERVVIENPVWKCRACKCEIAAEGKVACLKCKADMRRAMYAHGADWAKEKDHTVIVTFRIDVNPIRLIAYERLQREAWPSMIARYNERVMAYSGNGAHDNTGLGDVISDYLQVSSEAVNMVGALRQNMLSEYLAAIERREIEAPFIKSMEHEHRHASREDVFGGGDAHHLPDTIAAGALAYRVSSTGAPGIHIIG